MRLRPLFSAAAVVALGASLVIAPATSAAGTTRYVDDDGKAGPAGCNAGTTAKKTIQGAVDAANDGDTIAVCPGTYPEQVTITGKNDLTLRSVREWQAVITLPLDVVTAGGSEGPYMVGIVGANGITVRGFKLDHEAPASCDGPFSSVGILFVAARDISIRGNRVVGTGDTLGECGLFAGIMAGYPFGGPGSAALPAGEPIGDLTTTGLIAYNVVKDHAGLGIASVSTGSPTAGTDTYYATKVDIRNNSIQYLHEGNEPNGCVINSVTSASERRQLRSALRGFLPAGPGIVCESVGIYQGAGSPNAGGPGASGVISRNRISSGPDAVGIILLTGEPQGTPAQVFGILVIDQRHAAGASTVRENIVRRNIFGISAIDAKGIRILDNTVREAVAGISVMDTEGGATVRGNRTRDALVGIYAADEPLNSSSAEWYVTSGVQFKGNDATGNQDYSCEDDTEGDGTLGTANTWQGNDGEPNSSTPEGICGPAIE
jgi:hypothetical protein